MNYKISFQQRAKLSMENLSKHIDCYLKRGKRASILLENNKQSKIKEVNQV